MSKFKYIAILMIGVITGFFVAIMATKFQACVNVIKMVNWSGLTYWFTLFVGSTIPITVNYLSIKKQEVIKLKAKLAQDKIDILRTYKSYDLIMRTTVILNKKVSDLNFKYEPTYQDLSTPLLRGLLILENHERFSEWKLRTIMLLEQLNGLGSKAILNYTWYMAHYIYNLEQLIENIPDEKMWEVSIAVKNDFINMSIEFTVIIDKYLNLDLYKFKPSLFSEKSDPTPEEITKKLNQTNFVKYKNELFKFKKV